MRAVSILISPICAAVPRHLCGPLYSANSVMFALQCYSMASMRARLLASNLSPLWHCCFCHDFAHFFYMRVMSVSNIACLSRSGFVQYCISFRVKASRRRPKLTRKQDEHAAPAAGAELLQLPAVHCARARARACACWCVCVCVYARARARAWEGVEGWGVQSLPPSPPSRQGPPARPASSNGVSV